MSVRRLTRYYHVKPWISGKLSQNIWSFIHYLAHNYTKRTREWRKQSNRSSMAASIFKTAHTARWRLPILAQWLVCWALSSAQHCSTIGWSLLSSAQPLDGWRSLRYLEENSPGNTRCCKLLLFLHWAANTLLQASAFMRSPLPF